MWCELKQSLSHIFICIYTVIPRGTQSNKEHRILLSLDMSLVIIQENCTVSLEVFVFGMFVISSVMCWGLENPIF